MSNIHEMWVAGRTSANHVHEMISTWKMNYLLPHLLVPLLLASMTWLRWMQGDWGEERRVFADRVPGRATRISRERVRDFPHPILHSGTRHGLKNFDHDHGRAPLLAAVAASDTLHVSQPVGVGHRRSLVGEARLGAGFA